MRTKSRLQAARKRAGRRPRVAANTPASTSFRLSLYDMVKQLLTSHPAWQVRDVEGRWVCPYCCEPTGHKIEDGCVGPDTMRGIAKSVLICTSFDDRWPLSFRPLEEVRAGAAATTRRRKLSRKVSNAIARYPVWQVVDPDDRWVCPYCCAPVPLVDLDENGPDPDQVALHLHTHCAAYRERLAPARTDLELWERAGLTEQVPTLSELVRVESELRQRQQRHETDMKRAAQSQRSMMATPPALSGVDFAVHYQPGEYLANGFYDFLDLHDGRWGIVVGEVRGSGLETALVVGVCKKVISITAKTTDGPIAAVVESNEELFDDLGGTTDVALTFAVFDANTNELTFVRAGGEPPLIFRPEGDNAPAHDPVRRGTPLGAVRGSLFREGLEASTIALLPGDSVLFYTGSLAGAKCADERIYGRRRLASDMAELGGFGVGDAVSGIARRVGRHIIGASAPDLCVVGLGMAPTVEDVPAAELIEDIDPDDTSLLDFSAFDIDLSLLADDAPDTGPSREHSGEMLVDLDVADDAAVDHKVSVDDVIMGPIFLSEEYAVQLRDETRTTRRL